MTRGGEGGWVGSRWMWGERRAKRSETLLNFQAAPEPARDHVGLRAIVTLCPLEKFEVIHRRRWRHRRYFQGVAAAECRVTLVVGCDVRVIAAFQGLARRDELLARARRYKRAQSGDEG